MSRLQIGQVKTKFQTGAIPSGSDFSDLIDSMYNTSIIDVATAYGIVADGSTDNATALMQMRSAYAGITNKRFTFVFPGGEVRYSNNRWLYGIQQFVIEGNGTTFRTIYSGTDELLVRPFSSGTMFQTNTLAYTGSNISATPYLFNSVTAGSKTLPLQNAGDASIFSVGMLALIYGDDQVGNGYPPGARYYGWHTISAINSGTGILTLDRPVENTYKSTWPDTPGQTPAVGKPRIVPLDRTSGNYCRYAEFKNLTFGAGTNGQQGNLVFAARTLKMDNVICENGWTWSSENETAYYNNCIIDNTEFDKLVGKVYVKDSLIRGLNTGGFGCRDIEFENVQMARQSSLSPRYATYKNVTIRSEDANAALGLSPGFNPIRVATYESITQTSDSASTSTAGVQAATFVSITVGSVSGKNILFAYGTPTDTNALTVYRMEEGCTRLFKSDGTKVGTVTGITNDGTNWILSGTWPAPVAAEIWKFSPVQNVIDRGGHRILDNKFFFDDSSIRYQGNRSSGKKKTMVLTQADFGWTANGNSVRTCQFNAIPIEVRLNITKIAQFTSGKIQFVIDTPAFLYLEFNTKMAGYRQWNKYVNNGTKTGDSYDTNFFEAFAGQVEFNSNSVVGTVTADMLPEFVLEVDWIEL